MPTGAFVARRNGKVFITGNSGFPKSLDVSKAIDRAAGAEREVIGVSLTHTTKRMSPTYASNQNREAVRDLVVTAPATEDAQRWSGWGTALKPSFEPLVLARKPLSEATVAANVFKLGTGALNIEAARIGVVGGGGKCPGGDACRCQNNKVFGATKHPVRKTEPSGRWPANVILTHDERCVHVGMKKVVGSHPTKPGGGRADKSYTINNAIYGDLGAHAPGDYTDADGKETVALYACMPGCPVRLLDEQSGETTSRPMPAGTVRMKSKGDGGYGGGMPDVATLRGYSGDTGGASRFFYTAKAGSSERWEICRTCDVVKPRKELKSCHEQKHDISAHPTVKPLDLMRYLIRLVAPCDALILDPFAGTGTTLDAARLEEVDALGIEQDADTVRLARARLR